MISSKRSRAQPPNLITSPLSTQPRPFSRIRMVPRFRSSGCVRNYLFFWAKGKKECGLVSRIIKLHTASSSPARPVLVGFRAAFGPAELRLPLMRIMIRRLNDNSSLILLCLRSLCWPTWSRRRSTEAPFAPPLTLVGLGAKASRLSYLRVAQRSQDGIKHQLTPCGGE